MATIPWSVAEDSLDVNFSVPQLLRLRCTRNCFTDDWDQVLPLLKTDSAKARVQVWIDRSVVDSNPSVLTDLSRRLAESDNEIDLVAPVALVDGGEQIKNDHDSIESIFRAIDRDGLDRRSYVRAPRDSTHSIPNHDSWTSGFGRRGQKRDQRLWQEKLEGHFFSSLGRCQRSILDCEPS